MAKSVPSCITASDDVPVGSFGPSRQLPAIAAAGQLQRNPLRAAAERMAEALTHDELLARLMPIRPFDRGMPPPPRCATRCQARDSLSQSCMRCPSATSAPIGTHDAADSLPLEHGPVSPACVRSTMKQRSQKSTVSTTEITALPDQARQRRDGVINQKHEQENRNAPQHPLVPDAKRQPTISHRPTMSSDTFKSTNAHAPTYLAVNNSDREIGLLRSSVIEPGSNIWGMAVEVTRIAAIMPNTPTIHDMTLVSTHCLMNISIWALPNGSGSLSRPK